MDKKGSGGGYNKKRLLTGIIAAAIIVVIVVICLCSGNNNQTAINFAELTSTGSTLNSLSLNIDAEGEDLKYYYSIDGGQTYIEVSGPSFKIEGLKANTKYSIKVKIVDKNGNEKYQTISAKTAASTTALDEQSATSDTDNDEEEQASTSSANTKQQYTPQEEVVVVKQISGITIKTTPKTDYEVGDTLDVTNGKITVTYDNGDTEEVAITTDMVSGFDSSAIVASQTLTVTYSGKTTTYVVAIAAATPKYTYSMIYKDTDGSALISDVQANKKAESYTFTLKTQGNKTGYTFLSWNTKADGTGTTYSAGATITVTKDNPTFTLYARWQKNVHTITFAVNQSGRGAVSHTTLLVDYDTTITVNNNKLNIGIDEVTATAATNTWDHTYAFVNWTNTCGATMGDADCTITANFSDTTPTLSSITATKTDVDYVANETLVTSDITVTATYNNGKQHDFTSGFTTTPAAGYTFTETDATASTKTLTVTFGGKTSNITLNVTHGSYTVTFSSNGHGTAPESQTVVYDNLVTNPGTLTASGYSFVGWYKDQALTTAWDFSTDKITANTTIYAKWTESSVELSATSGTAYTGVTPTAGNDTSGRQVYTTYTPANVDEDDLICSIDEDSTATGTACSLDKTNHYLIMTPGSTAGSATVTISDSAKEVEYATYTLEVKANSLSGKKILWIGDSIMYGANSSGRAWSYYIQQDYGVISKNISISGWCFADAGQCDGSNSQRSFVHQLENNASTINSVDYDYIIIEGGLNDWRTNTYDNWGELNTTFGLETALASEIVPAFDELVARIFEQWPNASVGFIGTWKTKWSGSGDWSTYAALLKSEAEKWQIPVLEMTDTSVMQNGQLISWLDLTANVSGWDSVDVHPNDSGYKAQEAWVAEWIMGLPEESTIFDGSKLIRSIDSISFTSSKDVSGNSYIDASDTIAAIYDSVLAVSGDETFYITNEDYLYKFYEYDLNGDPINQGSVQWKSGHYALNEDTRYIRIVSKRTDSATLSSTDLTNMKSALTTTEPIFSLSESSITLNTNAVKYITIYNSEGTLSCSVSPSANATCEIENKTAKITAGATESTGTTVTISDEADHVGYVTVTVSDTNDLSAKSSLQDTSLADACAATTIFDATSATTIANTTFTLTDSRDNKSYRVRRLADGNCWMVDGLAIGSTTSTTELTPADTNITSNYTLPQLDATREAQVSDETSAGYLYTRSEAFAGQYPTTSEQSAPVDICPAGWHVPTNDDFQSLLQSYGGISGSVSGANVDSYMIKANGGGSNNQLVAAIPILVALGYPDTAFNQDADFQTSAQYTGTTRAIYFGLSNTSGMTLTFDHGQYLSWSATRGGSNNNSYVLMIRKEGETTISGGAALESAPLVNTSGDWAMHTRCMQNATSE